MSAPNVSPRQGGRGLWIAAFVMGAIIIALLAAVLFKMMQPQPAAPLAAAAASAPGDSTPPGPSAESAPAPMTAQPPVATVPPPPPAAPPKVLPAPAPKPTVQAADVNPAAPEQFAPQAAPPAAPAPVCADCGTVLAVTPHQVQSDKTNPLGVIAGGVVGGLLGNQVGNGNGRTAATVIGAIGGGLAGNEIAKRVDTQTVYEVQVRMDDGQIRTFQLRTPPPVHQRVRVGADGGLNPM